MKDISIHLITENKKEYLPLLLLGDELESDIDNYLERGDLFALYSGDVKSVCAVTDEGGGTAMKAILHFAVTNLGIKKVAGGHAKENPASAKVLEKLGFVYDRNDITTHIDGIRFFDSREYFLDLEV